MVYSSNYYSNILYTIIGGYGNRRDHPDLPSLSSLSPEPLYTTFRSAIPPKVPPKTHTGQNRPGIAQTETTQRGLPLQQMDPNTGTVVSEIEQSIAHLGKIVIL